MIKLLFTILLCFLLLSQTQIIDVYTMEPNSGNKTLEDRMLLQLKKIYNKKYPENKIEWKYIIKEKFSELFDAMQSNKSTHSKMAIMGITVTNERKKVYDFSHIYMPVKYCIYSKKESTITDSTWYNNGYNIVSSQQFSINQLQNIYKNDNVKFFYKSANDPYKLLDFLNEPEYDLVLFEGIGFSTDKTKIIHEFYEDDNGYGIMYPKGSNLKNKIDLVLKYLISSNIYYKILGDIYGKEESKKLFNYNKNKIFK